MNYTFAVVIPLFNHEAYIGEAIESVLAQSHPVTEIVIVDDGSSDRGYDIAVEMLSGVKRSRVLRQANAGAHNALNLAIKYASSTHIAVLNSDDVFEIDKLRRCADLFERHGDVELVFGGVGLLDQASRPVEFGPTVDWLHRCAGLLNRDRDLGLALLRENFSVTTSNYVFGKHLWHRLGGFHALRYCHDLDFVLAALNDSRVLYDREYQHIKYRLHPSNTIKERIDAVNGEIAAVLACNLLDAAMITQNGGRTLVSLERAVAYRGLSDRIAGLMPLHAQAGDRAAFYRLAFSPDYVGTAGEDAASEGTRSEDVGSGNAAPSMEPIVAGAGRRREGSGAKNVATAPLIVMEVGSFDKGGLEKVVLDSAIALRRHGFRTLVVSVGPVGYLGRQAIANGVEVVRLPVTDPSRFYAALLKARNVSLAISHFSRLGYPLFADLGIPNITFIHNVYAMLSGDALLDFVNDAWLVTRFISVSDKATDYAIGRLGVDPAKVETIPNGVPVADLTRRAASAPVLARSFFGLADDDYVFINVASYNLHKAHYLMAQALEIAIGRNPKIKLLCIGNEVYPPHVAELRAHIERRGLSGHMLMPGFQGEVISALRLADAFMLPSFLEGWSIAMTEAMFFGKPMILSDTGGSSTVIRGSDIGLLVPNEYGDVLNLDSELLDRLAYEPRDYETAPVLAEAMLAFAAEPERWRLAGEKGRDKVLEHYAFDDVVEHYAATIKTLLPEARGRGGQI